MILEDVPFDAELINRNSNEVEWAFFNKSRRRRRLFKRIRNF